MEDADYAASHPDEEVDPLHEVATPFDGGANLSEQECLSDEEADTSDDDPGASEPSLTPQQLIMAKVQEILHTGRHNAEQSMQKAEVQRIEDQICKEPSTVGRSQRHLVWKSRSLLDKVHHEQ